MCGSGLAWYVCMSVFVCVSVSPSSLSLSLSLSQVKCAQYWPSPSVGTITCGDIEVSLDDVAQLRDYTIRNFTIKHVSI